MQNLGFDNRKYVLYTWRLSADKTQLFLRKVSNKVVPDTTKDTATLQRLIRENLSNPNLLEKELVFSRQKY